MRTQIYYFSGTWNSLHVARELEKRLPDTDFIPIISVLQDEHIATTAETVGLVFPIHNLTVPMPGKSKVSDQRLQNSSPCPTFDGIFV